MARKGPVVGSFFYIFSDDQIQRLKNFADEVSQTQSKTRYYNKNKAPRTNEEMRACNLKGKMGELAVALFLNKTFGITAKIDLDIYKDRGDNEDLRILEDKIVEVKTTTHYGKYLILSEEDVERKKELGVEPDVYVLVKADVVKDIYPTGKVEIVGWAKKKEMDPRFENTMTLHNGDFLPGTEREMYNTVYVRHMNKLNKNWDDFINYLL